MAYWYASNPLVARDAEAVKDDIKAQCIAVYFGGDEEQYNAANAIWHDQVASLQAMADEFFRTQAQYAGEGTLMNFDTQCQIPGVLWPDFDPSMDDNDIVHVQARFAYSPSTGIQG